MASRIIDAVRNSPLIGRKGGYSPVVSHSCDPFVQGIPFNAFHLATVDVPDRVGTDKVHSTVSMALDEVQKAKKTAPKVTLIVKAVSITIKDGKRETSYPIYLISYCGNAKDTDVIFFFIYKNKADQQIRAEVFKCSSEEKVLAITRTVSKAFHIAYKAWQAKKRLDQRHHSPKSSPLLQQKSAKDSQDLSRSAVERASSTSAYYTPPIPRKTAEREGERPRSGSVGEDDQDAAKMVTNPALDKVKIRNETSGIMIYIIYYYISILGSTHDVTVTDDFDDGFGELASDRHGRPVSISHDNPDSFKFDEVKRHTVTEETADEPLIQF